MPNGLDFGDNSDEFSLFDKVSLGVLQGSVFCSILFTFLNLQLVNIIRENSMNAHGYSDDIELHQSTYLHEDNQLTRKVA